MQSYLHDIANRKGSYSIMKMKNHPIKMTNIISPEHDYGCYPNTDSDDGSDEYCPYPGHDHDRKERENDTTARVLFEQNADKQVSNEISPNRFREFDGSPPRFRGPNNIVLEHTMTQRGREVHFLIREHTEGVGHGETSFSVHVRGQKQQYSFHVPRSQVCRSR
jgi:hypothetical protein